VLRLLLEVEPEPSSPPKTVENSSVESSIMAHSGDGDPPQVETMRAESESLPLGERLKPPMRSAMNSRLLRRMVSPWEKPSHVKCSLAAETARADEGTIRTSRGNACCKSHFLARQLSGFSALTNYWVVKIAHSSSEVAFRTMKHIMIYPNLGPSSEVIALRPVISY
jgi:hypothetical protein